MITIEDAFRIAIEAHEGQKDLDGNPVILHSMTVAIAGRNREEQIAGLLHDVVEDSGITFEELIRRGVDDLSHNLQRGRAGGHWSIVAKHEKALSIIEPLVKQI